MLKTNDDISQFSKLVGLRRGRNSNSSGNLSNSISKWTSEDLKILSAKEEEEVEDKSEKQLEDKRDFNKHYKVNINFPAPPEIPREGFHLDESLNLLVFIKWLLDLWDL